MIANNVPKAAVVTSHKYLTTVALGGIDDDDAALINARAGSVIKSIANDKIALMSSKTIVNV